MKYNRTCSILFDLARTRFCFFKFGISCLTKLVGVYTCLHFFVDVIAKCKIMQIVTFCRRLLLQYAYKTGAYSVL